MRGVHHTREHFNKPFYDRDKEGIDQTPDYNMEANVIAKIRAGHQDFLTPKEKEVWDRMQGIVGEDDSYLVEPINKQVLNQILNPLGGLPDVTNMRDRPTYFKGGQEYFKDLQKKMENKLAPPKWGEDMIGTEDFKDELMMDIQRDLVQKEKGLIREYLKNKENFSLRKDALQEAVDIGKLTPSQINKIQSKLFNEEAKLDKTLKTINKMTKDFETLVKDPADDQMKRKSVLEEWNRINEMERYGKPK